MASVFTIMQLQKNDGDIPKSIWEHIKVFDDKSIIKTEDFAQGIGAVCKVNVTEEMIDAISELAEYDGTVEGISAYDLVYSQSVDFNAMMSEGAVNAAITELLHNIVDTEQQNFDLVKDNRGVVSKGLDWLKNKTGIGHGSDDTQDDLDDAKELLKELDEHPEKLREIYKEITGNELNVAELEAMYNGEVDYSDSDLINSVNKYKANQKIGINIFSSVISTLAVVGCIAVAPATGGLSLGVAAEAFCAGLGGYMIPQAIDGLTEKDGYSGKEVLEDFAHGTINSAVNVASIGTGQAVGTALSGGEAAAVSAGEASLASKFVQSEVTAIMMGDGIAAGDYMADVAFDKNHDFSWKELAEIETASTAASMFAGATAFSGSTMLKPLLTSGTSAQSQILGRLATGAVTGTAAGTTGAAAAGSADYLFNCLVNGKEANFEEWLDATTENAAGGAITGFVGGVAFEAVQLSTGTPKPQGAVKSQNATDSETGLKYTDYYDNEGRIIARDYDGKQLTDYIKGKNPSIDNANATRTVRFVYDYKTVQTEVNGNPVEITMQKSRGMLFDWTDKVSSVIGQQINIEYFEQVPGNIGQNPSIETETMFPALNKNSSALIQPAFGIPAQSENVLPLNNNAYIYSEPAGPKPVNMSLDDTFKAFLVPEASSKNATENSIISGLKKNICNAFADKCFDFLYKDFFGSYYPDSKNNNELLEKIVEILPDEQGNFSVNDFQQLTDAYIEKYQELSKQEKIAGCTDKYNESYKRMFDDVMTIMKNSPKNSDETPKSYMERITKEYKLQTEKSKSELQEKIARLEYDAEDTSVPVVGTFAVTEEEKRNAIDKLNEAYKKELGSSETLSYDADLKTVAQAWKIGYISSNGVLFKDKELSRIAVQELEHYEYPDKGKPVVRWMCFDDEDINNYIKTIPDEDGTYVFDRMQSFSKNEKKAEGTIGDGDSSYNVKLYVYPKRKTSQSYDTVSGKYGNNEVIFPEGSEFKVVSKGWEECTENGSTYPRYCIYLQEE